MSEIAKRIRKLIVTAAHSAKHGHIPSALSIVEIIDKTFHENDANVDVYDLACDVLGAINGSICDCKLILCFFLLNLRTKQSF